MSAKLDASEASASQIEAMLGKRLASIRLARNITQEGLAEAAGVASRTIRRLENGKGVSLNVLVRVLMALGLQSGLLALLPDPSVRPIERVRGKRTERQRARPRAERDEPARWTWGDEGEEG